LSAFINEISWLDILFAILLVGMVYKGARTGVGSQLLSFVGWVLLLFISITYYNVLSNAIFGFLLQKWAKPLSFFAIAAIVFVLIRVIERVFNIISGEEMASLEKIGGAIIASLRAILLFGLVSMLLLLVPIEFCRDAVIKKSKTGMFFFEVDAKVYSLMSGRFGLTKNRTKNDIMNEFLSRSR
jgi:uncharacterized membrane protein required for colicin V production